MGLIRGAAVCRSCGLILEGKRTDRLWCDACSPEQRAASAASALQAGRRVLGRLRAEGRDPAHDAAAAGKRGAKVARANRERARWRQAAQVSLQVFRHEILPRLREVPLSRIAKATGVSRSFASFIRRGLRTPHPRHFEVLRTLTLKKGSETMRTR